MDDIIYIVIHILYVGSVTITLTVSNVIVTKHKAVYLSKDIANLMIKAKMLREAMTEKDQTFGLLALGKKLFYNTKSQQL